MTPLDKKKKTLYKRIHQWTKIWLQVFIFLSLGVIFCPVEYLFFFVVWHHLLVLKYVPQTVLGELIRSPKQPLLTKKETEEETILKCPQIIIVCGLLLICNIFFTRRFKKMLLYLLVHQQK